MGIQWPLLLFAVFGGMGMGLLVYVALQIIRGCKTSLGIAGLVAAAALLAVGGAFSALHMGHPERSFYVLTNFASGISQELVATAIAMAVVVVLLVAEKSSGSFARFERPLAFVALAVGVLLPLVMGHAYLMVARPAWNTALLPLMFLGDSWAMGFVAAFTAVRFTAADEGERVRTSRFALAGLAAFAATLIAWLVGVAFAYEPSYSRSVERVLFGDLAPAFWVGTVVVGIAAPVAAVFFTRKASPASARALAVAALIGVFVGSVAVRVVMYSLGTSVQSFIY